MSNDSLNERAKRNTKQLTTRQQQALARQKQILDAAVRLFAENGFASTTTKQIAREVGVAEGLIFHYFPSKADLLTAALKARHSLVNNYEEHFDEDDQSPFLLVMQRLAEDILQHLQSEAPFMTMILSEAHINPEVMETLRNLMRQGISQLGTVLEARIESGELRPGLSPETLAHTFFGSIVFFFMLHRHLTPQEWKTQSEKFVHEFISNMRTLTVT